MRNVRRFFRLDIMMPSVIKLADGDEVIRIVIPEISDGEWQKKELNEDSKTYDNIKELFKENETAGKLLSDLHERIKLLSQGIISLVQGEQPNQSNASYDAKRKMAALITHLKSNSHTADMLRALNDKVEFYFTLVDAGSAKNYAAFVDMAKSVEFDFNKYLSDLNEKKHSQSRLAICLLELNNKILRHLDLLDKFQQEAAFMVNQNAWPTRKINLSAGGIGFNSNHTYPKFARLSIQMRIGSSKEQFNLQGNIVNSRRVSDDNYYIAVEFTNASEATQSRLILLLQNEELNQALAYLKSTKLTQSPKNGDDDNW